MSEQAKIHVYMMGSAPSLRGGMSSVVKQMLQHDWGAELEIRYIATHAAGSAAKRCFLFAKSYLYLLFLLLFQNKKVDILYLHMSYKGSFTRKYLIYRMAHVFGKKVIVHLHGSEFRNYYENSSSSRKQRICELFEGSACVIALGDYWSRFIHSIAPTASVEVVWNAVAIPEQIVSWNNQTIQLLYLGVLIPRKGVRDLIDAMQILKDRGLTDAKNIRLVIGGTGDEMTALQEQCRILHLEEEIVFAGWMDGELKKKLLQESQCLILPSYNEGLPVAILEALSYGIPVVSTDVGSIREAVLEGINGHLVKSHAPEKIADAVWDIVGEKEKWLFYSQGARTTAEQSFDETIFFRKIKKIFCSVAIGGKEK
ncbi:MAG: glycosyltransferase family 4 protein [Fusicatenibacter sp.]